jgi:uncharacterized protein YqgC (DUF456 family)
MVYLYALLLALVNLLGLVLTLVGLPGNWLMVFATALVAWIEPGLFSLWTLGGITLLALLGEFVEFFSGAAGAKRSGGTRRGSIGAILGGIIGGVLGTGMIPIAVIGTLIGMGLGAFLGAGLLELLGGQTMELSFRAARGAAVGRVFGFLAKFVIGIGIWLIVTVTAFWP